MIWRCRLGYLLVCVCAWVCVFFFLLLVFWWCCLPACLDQQGMDLRKVYNQDTPHVTTDRKGRQEAAPP